MKVMRFFVLGILVFACAATLFAQNNGVSANGTFNFSSGGAAKTIDFNARLHTNGTDASGEMTFSGPAEISNQDVDGDGTSSPGTLANLTVKVKFDCLAVNGNRAAMSGKITESSLPELVGRQSVLAVEDNGEGNNQGPDRFTWGLYRSTAITWTPSDAEVPGDAGWSFSWIATDAERPDDVGVPSKKGNGPVDCHAFPLSSYSFEEVPKGGGNIQVRP